jgi:hypothetical protein
MRILPKLDVPVSTINNKSVAGTEKEKEVEATIEPETVVEAKGQAKSNEKAELDEEPEKDNSEVELVQAGQSTLVDFTK